MARLINGDCRLPLAALLSSGDVAIANVSSRAGSQTKSDKEVARHPFALRDLMHAALWHNERAYTG